jgi:hypothetical protein
MPDLSVTRGIGLTLTWRKYGATVRMQPLPCRAYYLPVWCSELEFLKTPWGLGTEEE